jgi:uncharacterized phage infection (PIP) family protein YhgE
LTCCRFIPGGWFCVRHLSRDSAVAWADGVCTAATGLQTSVVQVVAALQIDPAASATVLDQAKAQARDRVAAVQQSTNDLRTAITTVPAEASDKVAAVEQQLASTADRGRGAADRLAAAAQQLADAQTKAETAAALAATATALAATSAGATASVEALRQAASSRDPVVRNAFVTAPACAALNVAPAAS